jgi:acyl carrier protein
LQKPKPADLDGSVSPSQTMLAPTTIRQQLCEFIGGNFLFGRECLLADEDSLAEQGIVDSTGVLQLVSFLEETYSITVEDEELTPENLDSIGSITAYLYRKQSAAKSSCGELP